VFLWKDKERRKAVFLSFFSLMKRSKNHTRSVFYEKAKKGNIISSLSRYKEAKIIRLQNCAKNLVFKLKSFNWTAERFFYA
jgi:oligoendopeptidase F